MNDENITLVAAGRVLIGMQIVERDGALLEVVDVLETYNKSHVTFIMKCMTMGEVRAKLKSTKMVRVFNAPFQSVLA